jgi:hypothetical protein
MGQLETLLCLTRRAKIGNRQLFNHEICKLLDMRRHVQAQGLGRFEIYHQLKFCGGLNGEIAWFFTFQNAIRVSCRKSKLITLVSTVGQQSAEFCKVSPGVHGR